MKLSSISQTYLDKALAIFYANTEIFKNRLDAIRATSKETGIPSKIIIAELNRRKASKKPDTPRDTIETPKRKEKPQEGQGDLFSGHSRINID